MLAIGRTEHIRTCGQDFWVQRSRTDPTAFRVVPDRCKHRLCPRCAAARSATVRRNLRPHLKGLSLRLLTLTLRASQDALGARIDTLFAGWRALRRTELWRSHVRGGLSVIEINLNPETHLWHVHLHAIIEGSFIPQGALKQAWLAITGDSFVVDIRAIRTNSEETAAKYVTKYLLKPTDLSHRTQPDLFAELVRATWKRKLSGSFGRWHSWRLFRTPPTDQWETLCHSHALLIALPDATAFLAEVASAWHALRSRLGTGRFTATLPQPAYDDDS